MEVGQLGNVVAAIAPDGSNALQLLSDLLLNDPSETGLVHLDASDGPDLPKVLHAEGLQHSEKHVFSCDVWMSLQLWTKGE